MVELFHEMCVGAGGMRTFPVIMMMLMVMLVIVATSTALAMLMVMVMIMVFMIMMAMCMGLRPFSTRVRSATSTSGSMDFTTSRICGRSASGSSAEKRSCFVA